MLALFLMKDMLRYPNERNDPTSVAKKTILKQSKWLPLLVWTIPSHPV